jgi:lysozyme
MKLLSLLEQVRITRISQQGIEDIKDYEGFRKNVYPDKGQFAIGYGTQVDPAKFKDKKGNPISITEDQGIVMLLNYLQSKIYPKVMEIDGKRDVPFNQNQFDALCSILYNLGPNGLDNTNLEKAIISRRKSDIIKHWTTGWKNDELLNRRRKELDRYLGNPQDKISPPKSKTKK